MSNLSYYYNLVKMKKYYIVLYIIYTAIQMSQCTHVLYNLPWLTNPLIIGGNDSAKCETLLDRFEPDREGDNEVFVLSGRSTS